MTQPPPQAAAEPALEEQPDPRTVIAAALDDWWITTDPAAPFHTTAVADHLETYLTSYGYRITPNPRTHHPMPTPAERSTCDASLANPLVQTGPCILRHDHDGPVHQDAGGATWWKHAPYTGPSRASVAFTAFLTTCCLLGALAALTRHDWGWAAMAAIGALVLGHELHDEITDRRRHCRRQT